jgi:outer membrane protein TolC
LAQQGHRALGFQAFNPKNLFWTPESLSVNFAGDLVAPLINKRAIRADYQIASAKQLQSVYNYQRVILNAFTEVVDRVSKVQNYSRSVEVSQQQVQSLEASVDNASQLIKTTFTGAVDPAKEYWILRGHFGMV